MRNRRWLAKNNPWRKCGDLVSGTNEPRGAPRNTSNEEIDALLKHWKECPALGKKRKHPPLREKKKKAPTPLLGLWKRRYVFWDLSYWKILDMPHTLDAMHITKNMCKSLLGTLLNMLDRTKDGTKERHDLKVITSGKSFTCHRPKMDSRRRRRLTETSAKGLSSKIITAPSFFTFNPT
jgi:hypothetical protein